MTRSTLQSSFCSSIRHTFPTLDQNVRKYSWICGHNPFLGYWLQWSVLFWPLLGRSFGWGGASARQISQWKVFLLRLVSLLLDFLLVRFTGLCSTSCEDLSRSCLFFHFLRIHVKKRSPFLFCWKVTTPSDHVWLALLSFFWRWETDWRFRCSIEAQIALFTVSRGCPIAAFCTSFYIVRQFFHLK